MHQAYMKCQDGFPRRWDPKDLILRNGIVDDRDTNLRTCTVLDAIASLSVYEDQHQVFAIAMQMDSTNRLIRLTIAENHEVEDKLIGHLTSVWGKLQALSDEYTEIRPLEEGRGESPPVPSGVASVLKVEIFRDLCLFSLTKHMARVRKWGNGFIVFMRAFAGQREETELDDFEQRFLNVGSALCFITYTLIELAADTEKTLTMREWRLMYSESMVVSHGLEQILAHGNGSSCEYLADKLKGISLFEFLQ